MTAIALLKGSSVGLTNIGDEQDYELLLEWRLHLSGTAGGIPSSGSKSHPTLADIKNYAQQPGVSILMIRTHDGRAIGFVNWQQLAYPGSIEMGCMIGDDSLWGAGYAMEAVLLVMGYQFHEKNAHRIQFTAAAFNKPMVQMLCSGVVRIEGVLRDYFFLDGAYHDMISASILRDEYYAMTRTANMSPTDIVPAADKDEARLLLAKYLADNPITIS
jgi:RimJ/RimL family protein N-acetyltransferase